jgi:hypothetical protein
MAGANSPDLDGLAELWRTNEPPTLELEADVRRRARLARVVVALEALLASAAAVAGLWAISLGGPNLVLGAAALTFAIFAFAASWWAHRGRAWAYDGLTVRSQLDRAISQTEAIRRWTRSGYAISAAAAVFLAAALFSRGQINPTTWTFAAGGLAYIAAATAVCGWLSGRQTHRLVRLKELRTLLFDGPDEWASVPPRS